MKTFRQFNEEASKSLEDLEREYASSSAGRAATRQAEVERARKEAGSREQSSDRFTQEKQREAASTDKQLKTQARQQAQRAEQQKAEREQRAQEQRARTQRIGRNIRTAAKQATRFVKSGARKIGNLIGRS